MQPSDLFTGNYKRSSRMLQGQNLPVHTDLCTTLFDAEMWHSSIHIQILSSKLDLLLWNEINQHLTPSPSPFELQIFGQQEYRDINDAVVQLIFFQANLSRLPIVWLRSWSAHSEKVGVDFPLLFYGTFECEAVVDVANFTGRGWPCPYTSRGGVGSVPQDLNTSDIHVTHRPSLPACISISKHTHPLTDWEVPCDLLFSVKTTAWHFEFAMLLCSSCICRNKKHPTFIFFFPSSMHHIYAI